MADAAPLIVHLRAADGSTLDLQVPAPVVRAVVRFADVAAVAVQAVDEWDGAAWQPVTS